jgi:hypothetical protein
LQDSSLLHNNSFNTKRAKFPWGHKGLKPFIQKADPEAKFKHKMKSLYKYHILLLNNYSRTLLNYNSFGEDEHILDLDSIMQSVEREKGKFFPLILATLLPIRVRRPGCQWFMPIILAIQEAETKRIMVQSQAQANSSGDPILKNPS